MPNLKLRNYQILAVEHIHEHKRCALFARMGMGKTPATLKAIDNMHLLGMTTPTLVIAPKRVAKNGWANETKKWDDLTHLEVSPIIGTPKERHAALLRDVPIYSINYENLPWLIDHFSEKWPFKLVVADEASKLKSLRISARTSKNGKQYLQSNGGGQRAKALAMIAHKHIARFIELTGTPAPNGLGDLWGLLWYIDGGQRLGRSYTAFEQRWFRPKYNGFGIEPLPHAQQEIESLISDVCLSLDPKDWFDLRAPIHVPVRFELPDKVREHYRDMEKEMFMELECGAEIEAFNAGSKAMKCRQITAGFAYREDGTFAELHDLKLQILESIYEEAGGTPLLVAYQFKADLERLMKAFPKGRVLDDNYQTILDFNKGEIPMLFAHPQSAGHGVDGLQYGTNIVVFFNNDWNLECREQFIERVGPVRQMQAGNERDVFIYDIVAEDTIDEVMLERLASKASVQESLLAAMKKRKSLLAL